MGRDKRIRPAVLLDTNMLMLLYEGIDVFGTLEEVLATRPKYIVLTAIVRELEKLTKHGKPRERRAARFALNIIRRMNIDVVSAEPEPSESVDDFIVRYALENRLIVATNDRELRSKLRKAGVPEAYYRESERRIELGSDAPSF